MPLRDTLNLRRMDPITRLRLRRASLEGSAAVLIFAAAAVALTWPVAGHLDEVILGGGELGGWLWRQWWHFEEVRSIAATDGGLLGQLATLLGLGRYPETGNILDVLLLSYPLEHFFGFPAHHNLKALIILWGNGLCGYALARSFTSSRAVSAAAGALAMANPITFMELGNSGFRQALLWWLLLYPALLQRAWRTGSALDGLAVGLCFVLIAAFYWFYGLFAVLFTLFAVVGWYIEDRPPLRILARPVLPAFAAAVLGSLIFVSPYLRASDEQGGRGGVAKLPELSFFLPFPAYDTIAAAPLRPSTYRENVLSSIHRTIDSGWPADYLWNTKHGTRAFPVAVLVAGIIPAFFTRRARSWLLIWLFFYLGTLGPFLKLGSHKDMSEVVKVSGEFVVRLPYAWMFQFIPGMSRMFAPYRLFSMVVVLSTILLALSLDRLRPGWRRVIGLVVFAAVLTQPFYRFDPGEVAKGSIAPTTWRLPVQVSAFVLPEWYAGLDPTVKQGIIELPLDQQQDILCAYQSFHTQKVYRSWASLPALPPELRQMGGGEPAERLRWLARAEPKKDPIWDFFRLLSTTPLEANLGDLHDIDLTRLMEAGEYRWLVIHERGFYLTEPRLGGTHYRHVVRALMERLGQTPIETVEQQGFEWPGKELPPGPAWMPWSANEVELPARDIPDRYFMSAFDLAAWREKMPTPAPPPAAPTNGAGAEPPPPPERPHEPVE